MQECDPDKLVTLEEKNRERLAGWWGSLGEDPRYPVGTQDAVRLLAVADYQISHDDLLAWTSENVIPPVPRQNGRLAWNATCIVAAACAAEFRRMWKPFSAIHGHKLTMVETLKQVLDREGQPTFNDLSKFDVPGLLGILHDVAGDRGATQIMVEALREKLKGIGVV